MLMFKSRFDKIKMTKIAFVPLNTNHVIIFDNVVRHLNITFKMICYDRISESKQYHTEEILNKFNLPYLHFPWKITRSSSDSFFKKILDFFKIRKSVKKILEQIQPNLLIFAIDNDPIAQIFINEAKKKKIKTVLIQEALIRPFELNYEIKDYLGYICAFLRKFGIFLNYIPYAQSGCNKILVAGQRAYDILYSTGISPFQLEILGQPKFDSSIKKIKASKFSKLENRVFLFIASTQIVKDDGNIHFLKKLVELTEKLELKLIIKLHPRSPVESTQIFNILDKSQTNFLKIIKGGDDTFDVLKKSETLITVSSTVILDALLMDKKCVVVDYLAGLSKLGYQSYNAVFTIKDEHEIEKVLLEALKSDKPLENKIRLLEDELFKLDGLSGKRVADFLESYV
jgi:hypothetical protein